MNLNENPTTSASQTALITQHLLSGKSITQMDALRLFGCFRLSSRITDIRKRNPYWRITSGRIVTSTGKRVASYSLDLTSVSEGGEQ